MTHQVAQLNDFILANGSRLIGGAISIAAACILLWARPKLSIREAIGTAAVFFPAALLLEYAFLPLGAIAGVRPVNAMDLLTMKTLTQASALIQLGYGLLLYAAVRRARTWYRDLRGDAAEEETVDARSVLPVRPSIPDGGLVPRALAPLASHLDGTLRPLSLSEAIAIGLIRNGIFFGYLIALVPGAVAVYFLDRTRGEWPMVVAAAWLVAFAALAVYLHRRRVMQLMSSAFCVVAVMGAAAYLRP